MANPALLSVVAHARAGALDHAWRLFAAAGFADDASDADVACVKGRLLKDFAARHAGAERNRLCREAAAAYERAAALAPASYPLINASTLRFLAGETAHAERLAAETLELIDRNPDEPETPYYRLATRAEALIVMGRATQARAVFAEAVALAPRAWEDHASTLRQFALILEAQGVDASWLDSHRPPRSLHFGGHMSFDPKVVRREHLDEKIAEVLEEEKIGFGYGALAAGADIIIAEALLTRGAELHAVLPGGVEAFIRVSVDPFGARWRKRFDAVLGRAETVRAVRPVGIPPDATMIALADEIAMGAALINARRLESRGVQLLVLADGASERAKDAWAEGGWRQRVICAPREETPAGLPPAPRRACGLLATLSVAVEGHGEESVELEARLRPLHRQLMTAPPATGPFLAGRHAILAWETPLAAARAAIALRETLSSEIPLRIGGHYGVAESFRDPFSGTERIGGDSVAAAEGALASTLPGTVYVTDDFAAALIAAGAEAPRTEYIGELDPPDDGPPVALHVLKS